MGIGLKARTHRPIFRGLAAESAEALANSIPELADYITNSVIVGRLPLSNMSNILRPLESVDGNRPTIAVGRREIGPVGTGLKVGRWGLCSSLITTPPPSWVCHVEYSAPLILLCRSRTISVQPASCLFLPVVQNQPIKAEVNNMFASISALYSRRARVSLMDYFLE